jgi:hypothetical protein
VSKSLKERENQGTKWVKGEKGKKEKKREGKREKKEKKRKKRREKKGLETGLLLVPQVKQAWRKSSVPFYNGPRPPIT